ncbi:hypothetical protein R0L47_05710 [Pectobacterium polonicum]|uniref:tail fiber/spike domain-containing protein n=1 Tax=Pectobacterium polonicum TaxID=2485124 RepID=UPI0037547FB9
MATTPTANPVPSESPRDLKFNAGKIDEFVTSTNKTYIDRLGNEHRTLVGIDRDANRAMLSYGYITKKSFALGNTLRNPNEVLFSESDGEYYRWDGDWSEPKVVPAGSTPEITGGIGQGRWIGVGDASLRGEMVRIVASFDSVSEMRGMKGLYDGQAARLLAYYSGGNLGGGDLWWVAGSTESDNGVTVFAVAGVSIGRWKRRYNGVIDAHWAGLPLNNPDADCFSQLKAIEQLMFNEGVSCTFHKGIYNIIGRNMPWQHPLAEPTEYRSYKNAALICDGPSVIFKTTSVTGADVFQLNGVSDFHIKGYPAITATISSASGAGSNGLSITGGAKNITADIECDNLPYTVKSNYIDGGKAVTIQPALSKLDIDKIKINCRRAENVSYGFGSDINMDYLIDRKVTSVDVFIDVDKAYRGVSIGGTTPSSNRKFYMGIKVRGFTKNCQQHAVLVRAWGVDVDVHSVNTVPKSDITVYAPFDPVISVLQMRGCKNSTIKMGGLVQDVETLYAVGGATYSAGIVGSTSNCTINLSVSYSSAQNVFDVINSNGNRIAECNITLNNIGVINTAAVVSTSNSLFIDGQAVLPRMVSIGGSDVTNANGEVVSGFTTAGYIKSPQLNSVAALGPYKGKNPVYAADGLTVIGWIPFYQS